MRVRSRLSERHRKKRHDEPQAGCLPEKGWRLVLLVHGRAFDRKEGAVALFRHDLGREYYDTRYRLPTRQMGWPTLGCNQQDLRGASERLVNCKPARMVPKVAGFRLC